MGKSRSPWPEWRQVIARRFEIVKAKVVLPVFHEKTDYILDLQWQQDTTIRGYPSEGYLVVHLTRLSDHKAIFNKLIPYSRVDDWVTPHSNRGAQLPLMCEVFDSDDTVCQEK